MVKNIKSKVPDVSVVLAVKNESKYIRDALESISTQKGLVHEVIVVDDNSTDDTLSIVESFRCKYPRLRIFKNSKSGKVSAFNLGVNMAEGCFVCLFAGDDIMPAGSLSARWNKVKNLPANKPVAGLYKILTMSNDKRYDGAIVPRAKGQGNYSGASPLMNREMVSRIFPVPEHLPNEDTWMSLALNYLPNLIIVHSDIICCQWRMHEGNSRNLNLNLSEFRRAIIARQKALELFYSLYEIELSGHSRQKLLDRIEYNRQYEKGSIMGIVFSSVDLISKLRALSSTSKFLYNMRKRYYRIFSGW